MIKKLKIYTDNDIFIYSNHSVVDGYGEYITINSDNDTIDFTYSTKIVPGLNDRDGNLYFSIEIDAEYSGQLYRLFNLSETIFRYLKNKQWLYYKKIESFNKSENLRKIIDNYNNTTINYDYKSIVIDEFSSSPEIIQIGITNYRTSDIENNKKIALFKKSEYNLLEKLGFSAMWFKSNSGVIAIPIDCPLPTRQNLFNLANLYCGADDDENMANKDEASKNGIFKHLLRNNEVNNKAEFNTGNFNLIDYIKFGNVVVVDKSVAQLLNYYSISAENILKARTFVKCVECSFKEKSVSTKTAFVIDSILCLYVALTKTVSVERFELYKTEDDRVTLSLGSKTVVVNAIYPSDDGMHGYEFELKFSNSQLTQVQSVLDCIDKFHRFLKKYSLNRFHLEKV